MAAEEKSETEKDVDVDVAADVTDDPDPPYLAQLLADYPTLTREVALEMIREAGG